jgi:hypothetical protein
MSAHMIWYIISGPHETRPLFQVSNGHVKHLFLSDIELGHAYGLIHVLDTSIQVAAVVATEHIKSSAKASALIVARARARLLRKPTVALSVISEYIRSISRWPY